MTIPFLTVKPKSIKLKVSPRFPAQLIGGSGIDVTKANGNYTIVLDVGEFGQSLVLPANPFTLVFDPYAESYSLVPPSVFASAIPEAPTDSQTYGRSNATWVQVVPLSGATMTGLLILSGDPTAALGATTKQYVDSRIATYLTRNYLTGLGLSTAGSSATFSVAVGNATDSTNVDMLVLGSPISKTTAAWAVGSGNGAWDGTGTNPTSNAIWQHVYLIKRTDTGVIDVLISASPTAPTMPPSYTERRRIGAMLTDASNHWILFHQLGDEFLWDAAVLDVNSITTQGTTATLYPMTVPTGLQVTHYGRYTYSNTVTAGSSLLVVSPDESTRTPGTPAGNVSITNANTTINARGDLHVRTNTSGQVYMNCNQAANNTISVVTYGWIDRRGRDA